MIAEKIKLKDKFANAREQSNTTVESLLPLQKQQTK